MTSVAPAELTTMTLRTRARLATAKTRSSRFSYHKKPSERNKMRTKASVIWVGAVGALVLLIARAATSSAQYAAGGQLNDARNSQLVSLHNQNGGGGGGASSQALQSSSMFKDLSGPTSGKIQTLDVICGKNFMTVRAEFSGPFYGIVFSKGTYGQENCIYVKPNSGLTHAAFNVYYDQCGTKPDLQGKFYENTIVIQYGSDIIEAYDEAKRLRCEWFEAYEKPATFKPAIPVADLEVVEMNFQGDDIDCWMEIQDGAGPSSREVSKIVPVGQPMTIVVAINDYNGQFDMRVKSCVAHDGQQQPISLTDEFGCVLRPKMLTPFQKVRNPTGINRRATILSYSRFLAFKFPDSMTVQIQCTVEVCRNGCADACQRVPSIAATTIQPELSLTAKWPAAANQAALEAPRAQPAADQSSGRFNLRQPARVQFGGRNGADDESGERRPPPAEAPGDDMSGSESSQQPAQQPPAPVQRQQVAPQQQQRRSQPNLPPVDGRIPQFLLPANTRRLVGAHGARLQPQHVASSTSTTTAAPTTAEPSTTTTMPPPTTTTEQSEPNRADGTNEEPVDSVGESDSLTRLSSQAVQAAAAAKEQSQDGVAPATSGASGDSAEQSNASEPAPADKRQPQAIAPANEQAAPPTKDAEQQVAAAPVPSSAGDASDQTAEASENKPSVQGTDDEQQQPAQVKPEQASGAPESTSSSSSSLSGSSLKTVEIEIPANEDPVRALMNNVASQQPLDAESGAVGQSRPAAQANSFQSVRLSSGAAAAETNGNRAPLSSYGSRDLYAAGDSIIQPRERQRLGDGPTGDELSGLEAASQLLGSGRVKFGARSQPPQQQQQAAAQNEDQQAANHQSAGEQANLRALQADSSMANLDRVLIDRSDESSLTEIASSSSSEQTGKDSASQSSAAAADLAGEESSNSNAKVRPVVGTDELATGPMRLEDRIGAPAQSDSLEETLNRLQHQLPRTAALVSSGQAEPAKVAGAEQAVPPSAADERQDSARPAKTVGAEQAGAQKKAAAQQAELNQPHPNVAGQAKVIPDPTSGVNSRGSLLAQASNSDGAAKQVLPAPSSIVQTHLPPQVGQVPPAPQQQHHLHQVHQAQPGSGPTVQITNVPVGVAPQLPSLQQFTQQMAHLQQMQQQQQQQQLKPQPTAKPARGRFNLLSPHAALQAVASRLLPKSAASQQVSQQQPTAQQQQTGQSLAAQLPQLMQNMKQLTVEQQQKLIAASQQQQQLAALLAAKQFNAQNAQVGQQQQQAPQAQHAAPPASLFARLSNNLQPQQQPLLRTRRSAIMPTGSGRGNGELGLTRTFMVVTGMDLAFAPNLTDSELPQVLEGRRPTGGDGDVIYGVCMPVVSLTFVLTCAFWLVVFLLSFSIYMLIKSLRQAAAARSGAKLGADSN